METFLLDMFVHSAHIPDLDERLGICVTNAKSAYDHEYIMSGGPNQEKWKPKAYAMLDAQTAYIRDLIDSRGLRLESVRNVEMWVSQQVRVQGTLRFKMTGKVDALLHDDQGEILVDWKTTTQPFTEAQANETLQLVGYQVLSNKTDARVAYCVVDKPDNPEVEPPTVQWFERTPTVEDRSEFRRLAISTHRLMETTNKTGLVKVKDPAKCRWCHLADAGYCEGVG